jgi:hypothetical protein
MARFDITYASVGYLYDYRAHKHPTESQIQAALPASTGITSAVDQVACTIRFTQPGVRIDLGGIAKGYAVDTSIAILGKLGITNATVTAGGDSRILGDRRGRPWIVGIRHPDDRNKVIARIPLEDAAISTSGDYERFFDEGGVRYHHIIDPKTGKSPHGIRSVTVIAPTSTIAEGLTKSVFIMGPDRGLALINARSDVDAVVVTAEGKVLYSKVWRRLEDTEGTVPFGISEPAGEVEADDVRVEVVERLGAGHDARDAQVAEVVIVEVDPVEAQVERGLAQEIDVPRLELVGDAEAERVARHRREFLVARQEVLEVLAREQVRVELRRILRVEAVVHVERPLLVERVRVGNFRGLAADVPGVGIKAVFALDCGAIGQIPAAAQRERIARARARIALRLV